MREDSVNRDNEPIRSFTVSCSGVIMIMRASIGCAIIVFNEERNIRECLETVRWMDEIVVVDAYSTDRTVEICQEFTDKIFQRRWCGFGVQKNFAIDRVKADWVFILDADERISSALQSDIEMILQSQGKDLPVVYSVPRKNFYYGKWVKHAGCYPDRQLRLFRNGAGHLDDEEPHNKFVFQGKLGELTSALDHFTERTINDHFRKFRNFTTLAAQERGRSKSFVYVVDLIGRPLFTFCKYYISRKGCADGIRGFLISVFASMYTFVKYAKLWDMLRAGRSYDNRPPRF